MSSTAIYNERYYCRGCGQPLVSGFRGLFHTECLKLDKRRRVQEERAKEREKFQVWLRNQECETCGAKLGEVPQSDNPKETSCEASQRRMAASSLGMDAADAEANAQRSTRKADSKQVAVSVISS